MVIKGMIGVVALIMAFSCLGTSPQQETNKPDISVKVNQDTSTYVLTKNKAGVDLPVPPPPDTNFKKVINLSILEVNNPEMVPVSFVVFLEQGQNVINIGGFSLYPANQPGIFLFDLSKYYATNDSFKNTIISLRLLDSTNFGNNFRVVFKGIQWGE